MYFLDFFAGIELFRLRLEQAGWTCKEHCEIDKYVNMSYQAIHHIKEGERFEEDITKASAQSLPDIDLQTGGFPYQNVSVAGGRRGLYGERTGLFFEFVRLPRERGYHRPRWLILENVKGIFSSGGGWDFAIVLCEPAALGYSIEYALASSKNCGVSQSRERVYVIGDLIGGNTGRVFPLRSPGRTAPAQAIGGPQGSRIYDTGGVPPTITSGTGGLGAKAGLYFVAKDEQSSLVTKPYNGTIDASYGKGLGCRQHRTGILESRLPRALSNPGKEETRQNGRRIKEEDEEVFVLAASDIHGILLDSRIRRLTPLEAFRLQGVPGAYFERATSVRSDAQLYKQIGNAVTMPVVRAINEEMTEYWKKEK